MGVVEYSLECGGETHTVGVDEEGNFVCAGCDLEEEEVNALMGGEASVCYQFVLEITKNSYSFVNSALQWKDAELLAFSIAAGANIDAGNGFALSRAVCDNSKAMVELLVNAGASLEKGSLDVLTAAVSRGYYDIAEVLLEAGKRIDYFRAVVSALDQGFDHILKLLLRYGADPNAQYGMPLTKAITLGNVEAVKLLLQYGADPFFDDERAITAISMYPHPVIEQYLAAACMYNQYKGDEDEDLHD